MLAIFLPVNLGVTKHYLRKYSQRKESMDFIEELRNLSAKITQRKDDIETEEGTKLACVLPFISLLEYDVSDPGEVKLEFTTDVGTKQGEKCDYAICRENEIIMLIECKKYDEELSHDHISQLYRYFSVVHARFGVLTNGVLYQFYTDMEEQNKMDARPFLEFNIHDIQPMLVKELRRFTKSNFDLNKTLNAATNLKYTKEIKQIMKEQLEAPTPDFVRFFLSSIYSSTKTQAVVTKFTDIVKRALQQLLNEQINERLQSAIRQEKTTDQPDKVDASIDKTVKVGIERTDQAQQGERKPLRITRLRVTMPDGQIIEHRRAKDTFVDAIVKLGLEEVMHVLPKTVSKEPFFPDNEKRAASTVQHEEFYINTNNSTARKKRILEEIATKLNLQLNVEIIDRNMA